GAEAEAPSAVPDAAG
nr:Chain E, GLU-ALA-PRO-SER-ALA [synthetic construct]7JTV_H Chain H, GLU-ALA-PRO-SER-ALA [synthetic construct]